METVLNVNAWVQKIKRKRQMRLTLDVEGAEQLEEEAKKSITSPVPQNNNFCSPHSLHVLKSLIYILLR